MPWAVVGVYSCSVSENIERSAARPMQDCAVVSETFVHKTAVHKAAVYKVAGR